MNNAGQDMEREEKAMDALIVAAFKEDDCDVDEAEIERLRGTMSAEEQASLDKALGQSFVDSLFGDGGRRRIEVERGALQSAMNRSDKDEDEPPSAKALEEMERKVREEEEKRKAVTDRRQEDGDERR
jgi:hypothetical protein